MKRKITLMISVGLMIVGFMVVLCMAGIAETEFKTFGEIADKVLLGVGLLASGCALGYKECLFTA